MTERLAEDERATLEDAFAKREAWAFEAAYRSYARLLTGAAYGVLGDGPAAEDCVHDVLERLWRRGHAYRPERGALSAFLAICVRNEARSRARRDANRTVIERELEPLGPHVDPMIDSNEHERIERALATLKEEQRTVIRLSYERGLTHLEIAQAVQVPLGTVKSRISSGLRALRVLFTAEGAR